MGLVIWPFQSSGSCSSFPAYPLHRVEPRPAFSRNGFGLLTPDYFDYFAPREKKRYHIEPQPDTSRRDERPEFR